MAITWLFQRIQHKNWLTGILKTKAMGLIREPEGVDFSIQSKPLTKEEEKALSAYIREYKEKHKNAPKKKKGMAKRSTTKAKEKASA